MINATQDFNRIANGGVRPLSVDARVSWTRERSQAINWFTLDESQLDAGDILAVEEDPTAIKNWNAYDFYDESSRVVSMNVERSVEFPFNIQSAIADITFDNHDGRYSISNEDSPLADYILPKRPLRLLGGFKKQGTSETIPMFIGLTQGMPTYEGRNENTASMTALDFLSDIANMKLNQTVMLRDARTDEVIAMILAQYGLDPSQYILEEGLNVIPFVAIESGASTSNVLQKLVQAENGSMWLDENGLIRFTPRTSEVGQQPVMEFDDSNIVDFTPSRIDGIVNHVIIKSDVRQIQDNQPIFQATNDDGFEQSANDDQYRIGAFGKLVVWFNMDDPIWIANELVLNGIETDSNFKALDLSGGEVLSGITATGTLFTNSYKATFTNTNPFPVSLNFIELWGQPAKVIDVIDYDAYESDSVDRFGEQTLEISDNNFFGSYKNADSYATHILRTRSEYSPTITLKVKGNPALQLSDVVHVVHKDIEGDFKVVSIKNTYSENGGYECEIVAERFIHQEFFILDRSILNGGDVLGA